MTDNEIISKLTKVYDEFVEKLRDAIECNLTVKLSNRYKTRAGNCRMLCHNTFIITLSKALFNQFGYERIEKCFRHELAHVYCLKMGVRGHDMLFKRICKSFGGSMNARMAGSQFKENGTTEYIRQVKKWKYTCNKCNSSFKRARKMSSKIFNNPYRCCINCNNPTTNFTEEKLT